MSNILLFESDTSYVALVDTIARKMSHTTIHVDPSMSWNTIMEQTDIALIIVDLPLPYGESGWETIHRIKLSELKHVPLVAMSVIPERDGYERAQREGCHAYLRKPHSAQTIAETIQHFAGGEIIPVS
jgi:CheY-like chemotaxis protein